MLIMEEKKYLSKRGLVIYLPLAVFPFIFSFGFLYVSQNEPENLMLVFWIFVLLYVFLLTVLKTNYTFSDDKLKLKLSFFKKTIAINEITKLTRGNHFWFFGWKFALATKGLVLSSNKSLDILITPEQEEEFIEELLKINPAIKIIEK
jgi:hypothetical protein